MTIDRLRALRRYWRSHPPVHILVAGAVGFKPELEPVDLPEGAFAAAANENAEWFADPARFFDKARGGVPVQTE